MSSCRIVAEFGIVLVNNCAEDGVDEIFYRDSLRLDQLFHML